MSTSRDMLAEAFDDPVCDWCGEIAPSVVDAEEHFGHPDCGHICPSCVTARAQELDEAGDYAPMPVWEAEEWR